MIKNTFTLSNGTVIPSVGFGTWRAKNGIQAKSAVSFALECGYRHIDTACAYQNEESIGEAINKSNLSRDDIFVTSKLWTSDRGYDNTLRGFEKSLKRLNLEYLDLYLIHWPANHLTNDNWNEINQDTWKALCKLYKDGRVKAIGVSNFMLKHIEPLMECEIIPMVNQIEYHPGFMQNDVVSYCKERNILIEAWSPLGAGRVLNNKNLLEISQKYGCSVAQLCIKWCIQNGVCPLPKSVTPDRIKDNINVFEIELSPQDINCINSLPVFGQSGHDPDNIIL